MFEETCAAVLSEAAALVTNRNDAKLLIAMKAYWTQASTDQLAKLEYLFQLPLPQEEPK